ncbi:hypothetical protein [Amantichitinum ursilacus]|uniref:Uncharacterized protein n=1 Tax=Amantichitinum ursilacus TaxID=857265 RepID=A0A0N0GR02_9NEIS|nr:hypothetical protein [Amantichitinum ursilacus]KPC55350.1 hypothetical protein WG78_01795 [Amantichitinum ursilacus]
MNYLAKIKRLSSDVEEEVVLCINDIEITCFANVCPYTLEDGEAYRVELTPQVFNDYVVSETNEGVTSAINRVGNGFSYILKGRLAGNKLDAGGIVFEDEMLLSQFGYLDGKFISWNVDRIDVEFLSND